MDTLNKQFQELEIGDCIRILRLQRGLTQVQLAYDSTLGEICSSKQLSRYENNEGTPNHGVLSKLLIALGSTHGELDRMMNKHGLIYFNEAIIPLKKCFYNHDYQNAEKLLHKIKRMNCYNLEYPIIKQRLLFYEGVIQKNYYKEHRRSLGLLYNALKETSKNTLFKTPRSLDFHHIKHTALDHIEYDILNSIASVYFETGRTDDALTLMKSMIDSLELPDTPYESKVKSLPVLYFNVSNYYLAIKDYSAALQQTSKGIDFCHTTSENKELLLIYYNHGCALYESCNKSEGITFFKKSLLLAELLNNQNYLNLMREELKTNYNLVL